MPINNVFIKAIGDLALKVSRRKVTVTNNRDIEQMQKLIEKNITEINGRKAHPDYSPCLNALTFSMPEIAMLFIKNGADLLFSNHNNRTLLYEIIERLNGQKMIKELLKEGFNISAETIDKSCILPKYTYYENADVELVKLLLEHGADINIKSTMKCNSLFSACNAMNIEMAEFLVEQGIDLDAKDGLNETVYQFIKDNRLRGANTPEKKLGYKKILNFLESKIKEKNLQKHISKIGDDYVFSI